MAHYNDVLYIIEKHTFLFEACILYVLSKGSVSRNIYLGLRFYFMLKDGKLLVNFSNTSFYI